MKQRFAYQYGGKFVNFIGAQHLSSTSRSLVDSPDDLNVLSVFDSSEKAKERVAEHELMDCTIKSLKLVTLN